MHNLHILLDTEHTRTTWRFTYDGRKYYGLLQYESVEEVLDPATLLDTYWAALAYAEILKTGEVETA